MYILIAILAFGILIAIHEGGHFAAAKLLGVKVNEFAIGMGPALLKKQGKETLYSLRLLPIGGYCAMEGEDEESPDPRAFTSAKWWKRVIILCAGSFMNLLLGFVIVLFLCAGAEAFVLPVVESVADSFLYGGENGLMPGDEIYKINGHRIYYSQDFSTYMTFAGDTVDMEIIRGGEKILLDNYGLKPEVYIDNGVESYRYGLNMTLIEASGWEKLKYGCYETYNFGRMVFLSFEQLFTGKAGLRDVSGVVGIVDMINDVGEQSETVAIALENIAFLIALVAVSLAVMNMLPIPALDGGRVFLLLVSIAVEKLTRKHLDPKYEGYVHAAGMILLLSLMAVVLVNDIVKIVGG